MSEKEPSGSGRPRAFDDAVVLEAIMQSFWKRGYQATTLEHLLADTKLSKSSLYNAFGGKEELFTKALARYLEQEKFLESVLDDERGATMVLGMLESFAKPATRHTKGCLMQRTMLENATRPAKSKHLEFVSSYLREVWDAITMAMKKMKPVRKRHPLSDEEKAAVIVSAMFGRAVIARNGRNEQLLQTLSDALVKIARNS
ncbi:MAG: TetR/AcrR family transcriptional regulator [Planctomycetota bacterium]